MTTFNPYDHFGFLTNRVARLIMKSHNVQHLGELHNFPVSCIGILADLWARDGVNQKELGSALIKTKSSINKMLSALEQAGLIEKRINPEDTRSKLIFLTDRGKKMQYIVENKGRAMEELHLTSCTPEEIQTAKKVLAVMYENLSGQSSTYSNPTHE